MTHEALSRVPREDVNRFADPPRSFGSNQEPSKIETASGWIVEETSRIAQPVPCGEVRRTFSPALTPRSAAVSGWAVIVASRAPAGSMPAWE
ncbi:MAG: hypothetical protein FD137_2207 [Spirochaetes bacterium]|nr:MAG: hypothetical protein FD137_2207 [Spirochaetota bacterium]